MAFEITPELLTAIVSLLGILLTGAFAYMRDQKILADDQGDKILAFAGMTFATVKVAFEDKPEYADELEKGEKLLDKMTKAWNDSKVRTPEFNEYFEELMGVVAELA